jgi:hypothetical protein
MTVCAPNPTPEDWHRIEAFSNFLSWGEQPSTKNHLQPARHVPPAWWAYTLGATTWCPPKGEL